MDEISSKRRFDPVIGRKVWLGFIIIVIGLTVLAIRHYQDKSVELPPQLQNVASQTNFPVYYPSRLPAGYNYTDGSAKFQSGLFYYQFHDGTKVISVTQQSIPASSVNLQKLPKYSSLDVPAGPAAVGVSVGNPSVVIATGSTLVNINSSKGVSKDTVVAIAQKIKAVGLK